MDKLSIIIENEIKEENNENKVKSGKKIFM